MQLSCTQNDLFGLDRAVACDVRAKARDQLGAGTDARRQIENLSDAGLAQLVEHLICNQGVGGSNPSAGTGK